MSIASPQRPKVIRVARTILLIQIIFTLLVIAIAYWVFNNFDPTNQVSLGLFHGLNDSFGLHPDEDPTAKVTFIVSKLLLPFTMTTILYFFSGISKNYFAILVVALITFLIGFSQSAFPLLSLIVLILFLIKPSRVYYMDKDILSKEV